MLMQWKPPWPEVNFPEPFTRFFKVFRDETVYGSTCKVTGANTNCQ